MAGLLTAPQAALEICGGVSGRVRRPAPNSRNPDLGVFRIYLCCFSDIARTPPYNSSRSVVLWFLCTAFVLEPNAAFLGKEKGRRQV